MDELLKDIEEVDEAGDWGLYNATMFSTLQQRSERPVG